MKKGQVAAEYVIIVGFSLLALIGILIAYGTYKGPMEDKAGASQALQIARKIVDASESVYYLGPPSKTTLKVFIPVNMKRITFSGNEVIIDVTIAGQQSEIVQQGVVNMTGNITVSGIEYITITAQDDGVLIS
jgi:uncharacterized protein (UPF0333 family)